MPVLGSKQLIEIGPGVTPSTDATNLDSFTFVNGDKIRFQNGKLRKLGGCNRVFFTNNQRITGVAKSVFEYVPSDNIVRVLIGTTTRLYCYMGTSLYNITPLQTSSTGIANSISTFYKTDSAYSITTTAGSNIVTFNIPHYLQTYDTVTISGVTGTVGGLSNTYFNDTFSVVGVTASNAFQVLISANAISNETAGGTTINIATSQIVITKTSHGLRTGDRIKIEDATDVANILAASINIENIVSGVMSPDVFLVSTDTIANSSVSGGGGGAAILYKQLPYGSDASTVLYGYGMGFYGIGLYGVPTESTISVTGNPVQVWTFDTFSENIVLCPGNQGNIYSWDGDVTIAPVVIAGAPVADWVFESHGMVCALNPDGQYGYFQSSNIGDFSDWTPSASSTASILPVPGANRFISQGMARDVDLLYTDFKVYQLRYDGFPFIWNITEFITTDGIIAPKARCNVEDAVFWMGNGDFFVFDGTSITILPNNTVKRYVYDNLNQSEAYKCFGVVSTSFNEIYWFYPSGTNNQPDSFVIYNYKELHWSIGTFERTAGLEPPNALIEVLMVQSGLTSTVVLDPDPISTNYYSLGTNPFTTTNGSASVVANITGHKLLPGDTIEISGSNDVNGILGADINGTRTITNTTVNTVIFTAGSNATSTGVGGGSNVEIGTSVLTVACDVAFENNSYVTIASASAVDNFTADDLTGTFVVRNFTQTTFDIAVSSVYSSANVSGGGEFVQLTYDRTGRLFQHETTYNDYDENCDITNPDSCVKPLYSFAETNYVQFANGNNNVLIYSVIPDSTQQGTMQLSVNTKQYPQGVTVITKGPFDITQNVNKIDVMALGRQRQYVITSNALDQNYILGKWFEQITETTPI